MAGNGRNGNGNGRNGNGNGNGNGKSNNNKTKNRKLSQNPTNKPPLPQQQTNNRLDVDVDDHHTQLASHLPIVDANPDIPLPVVDDQLNQAATGTYLYNYTIPVNTLNGDKLLDLQLTPEDSVLEIRQYLLQAPLTCFLTSYHLFLHTKDGSTHHLENFNLISDVANITTGGCSLEMVDAPYDDVSIRAHVHRTRDLLSLSNLHTSLSTVLALKYETAQKNNAPNSGDAVKTDDDVQDLDGLRVMEDAGGSLGKLLLSSSEDIICVDSIVFSSFNPPPSHRRLVGDLIYLDVETLEGNKFCITGSTKTFYANSSSGEILDPRPTKSNFEATTLIGLLQKISSNFTKAFLDILERKGKAHPFENVQSMLPPNPWLGSYPFPEHRRDAARSEDAVILSYGTELELIGMHRDWNEDLQSCREFPQTASQERILRDRALYKITSDFVDAAVSGAVGVINRCVPPINPTDPECFHMYVHNNIFFSFAVDGDLKQLSNKIKSDINSNIGNTNAVPNSSEKGSNERDGATSNGENCDGLSGDLSKVGGEAQCAENEQATYASANNDLKGTIAYQEADVPGLYNLSMAIIDYRGHRVIAQSVLPGILQGDKSDSLLYGSVDNAKKIRWNEDFHSKMVEAAKRLHLKEHLVLDGSGNEFRLAAPVECKGIYGSDNRLYVLDMMRVTPRDANRTGPGSRFCILRPELIKAFCQCKDGAASGPECAPAERSESREETHFNPNVFTEFKLAGSPTDITADEENVRKVSSYLVDIVLPKFVQDLCALEVSPMDGQTLTEALHVHGINVRYIGKVAEGIKHFPHLWDLCCNEIVVRCAKHILKDVLRGTEDHDVGSAIAHVLTCLFGSCQAVGIKANSGSPLSRIQKKEQAGNTFESMFSRAQSRLRGRESSKKNHSLYMNVSSESLWSDIQEFAKLKYQFEVPEDARERVKKVTVFRNLCQKGMLSDAYSLFSDAFALLQQVTGPLHREVAHCCRYLAMILYHHGDMPAAIVQQHKELIINERCLGLDHPDTAHSYGNLALFYHALNRNGLALQHMVRALLILSSSSGPDHPDVAATFINLAMMYQDVGKMNTALRYLQEALQKNERLLGKEHIQTAVCYHALAIAFNCMGAYKFSHQHEKKTHGILVKQFGEEDSRTKDSQAWLKTFKMRELQMNAQKEKVSAQKTIDILKDHPELIQVLQAAAVAQGGSGGGSSSATAASMSLSEAVMGEPVPGGRGNDERAARATAEMRKKVAARGILNRCSGVPVQAVPPVTKLPKAEEKSSHNAPVGLGKGLAKKPKASTS
ncbi:hypothetical protein ACFE04_004075 [Oxalis oulophora]